MWLQMYMCVFFTFFGNNNNFLIFLFFLKTLDEYHTQKDKHAPYINEMMYENNKEEQKSY